MFTKLGIGACALLVSSSVLAAPLQALNEVPSIDGVLNVTLEAAPKKVDIGPISFEGLAYNGDYAGPLLRAQPGDVMHVKLVNHLDQETNLHFHGFHASPLGHGDNVYIEAKPGETLDYIVNIAKHQPPGLYWYHVHVHGKTEDQVNRGLSGPLLIDGFLKQFPELSGVAEKVLLLKQYNFDKADTQVMKDFHHLVETINGQLDSTIAMHKGETQLWHIGNTGPNSLFHLSLRGHTFRIIGRDGVALNKEIVTDKLVLSPATRYEVLVDAGDRAGHFDIVSDGTAYGSGDNRVVDRVLGGIDVDETAVLSPQPIKNFPSFQDLSREKITGTRDIVLTQNSLDGKYFINGQLYDHNRTDIRVPLGSIEEWTVRNDSEDFHVFHIHQLHFQVAEINGVKQPYQGYQDNVDVPSHTEVKIIISFTDPVIVGKFVYHCHVLEHEDKGMMASIEVYDPKKESRLGSLWRELAPHAVSARRLCGIKAQGLWEAAKIYVARL